MGLIGRLRFSGIISNLRGGTRAICYCTDCQIYAHYLKLSNEVLNSFGGTEVISVRPNQIFIQRGIEYLSCVSLTELGAFRFFTNCCKTPICNMSRNYRTEHIAILHNCLNHNVIAEIFENNALHVKRESGKGNTPKNNPVYFIASSLYYSYSVLLSHIYNGFKFNPFINQGTRRPVVSNIILSTSELNQLKKLLIKKT